jgi:formylglycine-generating enzyme required for sulfatase activity
MEVEKLLLAPTLSKFSFEVIRSDRDQSEKIDEGLIRLIQTSDLCIIDLTGDNPNVYYECGRRHESQLPYVQIRDLTQPPMPFDIRQFRTVFYDLTSPESIANAVVELTTRIKAVLPGYVTSPAPKAPFPKTLHIPPGEFTMGEDGFSRLTRPAHKVKIGSAFEIGIHPVTFEEYDFYRAEAGVARRPDDEGWGRGRRPVINVSWHDAVEYCKWLSQYKRKSFRLPSESEWEYACRAVADGKEQVPFAFGDKLAASQANFGRTGTPARTISVDDLKVANKWGLFGMHGNVWEWTADDWFEDYNTPSGPHTEAARDHSAGSLEPLSKGNPVRGGSWYEGLHYCRSSTRVRYPSAARTSYIGFRVVQDIE